MRSRFMRLRAPVAAGAAAALVVLTAGAATADGTDPVDPLVSQIQGKVKQDGTQTQDANRTSASDQDAGAEASKPSDYAEATVLKVQLGGQDLLEAAHSRSTIDDDESTSADSTLLAIGGQEVMGAHADSQGGDREAHFGDFLSQMCTGSDGQLCLALLYADAWASSDDGLSQSDARNGVARLCAGGNQAQEHSADCRGQVEVGLLESSSHGQRDHDSGATSASSENHGAQVCLRQDLEGECTVSAVVLQSHSSSYSGQPGTANEPDAEDDSSVATIDLDGNGGTIGDQPVVISIPENCPDPSAVCAALNQAASATSTGGAASEAQVLGVQALKGTPVELDGTLAASGGSVHNDAAAGAGPSEVAGVGSGGPGAPGAGGGAPSAGLLPNTGGFWSGLLALGLFGIAAGAFAMAYGRRRSIVLA